MIAAHITQGNPLSFDGEELPQGTVSFDGLDKAIIVYEVFNNDG